MTMECPDCYGATTVYFTQTTIDGVVRRRKCLNCGARYVTLETIIKKEGEDNATDRQADRD